MLRSISGDILSVEAIWEYAFSDRSRTMQYAYLLSLSHQVRHPLASKNILITSYLHEPLVRKDDQRVD